MASAAFWFSLVLWTTTCFLLGVRGQTFEFTTTVEEYCTNSHYVSYSHPASFQVGTKTIALWDTNKSPYEKAKCTLAQPQLHTHTLTATLAHT